MPSGTRSILQNRIPKSFFNVRGSNDEMVVHGHEVIAELTTSQKPLTASFPLNAAQSQLFPKLSGLALQWERYRFNKVRLHYYTAAPATRSGALGMVVLTQYDVAEPSTFLPELGSFPYSAVGTIANNMSTPWWVNKDPEFFMIGTGGAASADPLKVFQGRLFGVVRDSVASDAGLVAGYLAIEYDCTFRNSRPTLDRVLMTHTDPGYTYSASSNIDVDIGDPSTAVVNSVGRWGEELSDRVSSALDTGKWIYNNLAAGAQAIGYLMDLSASTTSAMSESSSASSTSSVRVRERKQSDVVEIFKPHGVKTTTFVNPKFIEPGPTDVVLDKDDCVVERDEKTRFAPVSSSDDWRTPAYLCEKYGVATAAGDISVTFEAIAQGETSSTLIFSDVTSAGTGAQKVRLWHIPTLPDNSTELNYFYTLKVPSGESRVLNALDTFVAPKGLGE